MQHRPYFSLMIHHMKCPPTQYKIYYYLGIPPPKQVVKSSHISCKKFHMLVFKTNKWQQKSFFSPEKVLIPKKQNRTRRNTIISMKFEHFLSYISTKTVKRFWRILVCFLYLLVSFILEAGSVSLIFSKVVSVSFAHVIGMGIVTFSAILWPFYDLFVTFSAILWPFCDFCDLFRTFSALLWPFCEWQKGS